jgi:hypothetical protein
MVCKKCRHDRMHRIARNGFFRVRVAPLFGFFPWKCSICGAEQLLRARGTRKRSQATDNPREETLGQSSNLPHVG